MRLSDRGEIGRATQQVRDNGVQQQVCDNGVQAGSPSAGGARNWNLGDSWAPSTHTPMHREAHSTHTAMQREAHSTHTTDTVSALHFAYITLCDRPQCLLSPADSVI